MKNISSIIIAIISAVLAIVGTNFLINSVAWGKESADIYLITKAGGSIDTTQYLFVMEQYININKWVGVILLSVGLIFLLWNLQKLDYTKLIKKAKELYEKNN